MSLSDLGLLVVLSAYVALSMMLFGFGMNLLAMSVRVSRRSARPPAPAPLDEQDLPVVTVQIPIYNELYVSRRIIEAVCAFDYPQDRLEIQVLDDSTDETSTIVANAVARARSLGIDISHIRRTDRTGYKAGALAAGTKTARGTFLAIFDADFIPEPDFLRRALPHFDAPDVAFVQARWGHANRDFSWLTRVQAVAIDGHFLVEQAGRGLAGYWFNFNGTAGVWRAEAIVDAGGWKADTLTEDLDLSYRAHLAGWTARFVEDLVVPAEVPAQLSGFRRQQHRWARGSLECAARLLPRVWRAEVPFWVRAQATLHLTAYTIQLLLLALLLLYPFVVLAGQRYAGVSTVFGFGYIFAVASIAPTLFFVTGSRQNGRRWVRDLPQVLMITAFGAGLVVNTARAALEIFTRPNPSFERTAKFGLDQQGREQSWTTKRYQLAPDRIVFAELALACYAAFSALLAFSQGNYGIFAYASVFFVGLASVVTATMSHTFKLHRHRGRRARAVAAEAGLLG
jgi:cellulose synthase/poly-beta-1,6-N-acetylglucosamine synthase-like glycosyltransferase